MSLVVSEKEIGLSVKNIPLEEKLWNKFESNKEISFLIFLNIIKIQNRLQSV